MAETRGRPTKLTPDLIEAICEPLSLGVPVELACEAQGICRRTFYGWKAEGERNPDSLEGVFLHHVKMAIAKAAIEINRELKEATKYSPKESNWTPNAWLLERRFREFYGRTERREVEVSGKGGGPIEQKTEIRDERFERIAARGPDAIAYFLKFHRDPSDEDLAAFVAGERG